MIVIGVTGSMGMGKTSTTNMLRSMGFPVHCSDQAVHGLLARGGAGVAPVTALFPVAYDKKSGAIDRARLRRALGNDHAKWDELESVLHPLVRNTQQRFLKAQKSQGAEIAVLDIPLLFETGAEQRLDYTICVTAPPFIQEQRLNARGSADLEDRAFRLARQMPDEQKRRYADFVVHTGLGLAYTHEELRGIIRRIRTGEYTRS